MYEKFKTNRYEDPDQYDLCISGNLSKDSSRDINFIMRRKNSPVRKIAENYLENKRYNFLKSYDYHDRNDIVQDLS